MKPASITIYTGITPDYLDRYAEGNDLATVDSFEGCLLDPVLYEAPSGAAVAAYETVATTWTSYYTVEIGKPDPAARMVSAHFADAHDAAEAEAARIEAEYLARQTA